jgi:hypothetical protein
LEAEKQSLDIGSALGYRFSALWSGERNPFFFFREEAVFKVEAKNRREEKNCPVQASKKNDNELNAAPALIRQESKGRSRKCKEAERGKVVCPILS